MAEAILFNIAGRIISKLASPALQETKLWWTGESTRSLRNSGGQFQPSRLCFLMQRSNVLLKQMIIGNKMVKEVRLFFSSSNPFVYGLKMAHKIENVRSKLDEIAASKKFHLDKLPEKTFPMIRERKQTHSSLPQVVVGREDDKKKIIDFLLSSSHGEDVSIISIVGIGGLGKTTLAQLAYNDATVKSNFKLKIWVCISENFDVKIIDEKILESLDEKPKNLEMNT
ncbi:hypothetical protein GH714_016204 [Hevea brasiliensis]|uniref:NB-ARC domain-containing protein n=1 Tax=Hevea brasiliensis TaxID=3981 RepID=A0A6A6N4G2_HEVBR|nr:hypothetical protein GH714_016204 [Hevea brasiliensis]